VAASRQSEAETQAPGAHSPQRRVPTMMTTADMALKVDPEYRKISERFRDNPAISSPTPLPAPGSS
jgi:catalase (peroxidase I)